MNDRPARQQAEVSRGLCASCRHARVITSDRGNQFVLCEKSKTDARYPRFPALPVFACDGYEPPAPRVR